MKQAAVMFMVISWIALIGAVDSHAAEKGRVRVSTDQQEACILIVPTLERGNDQRDCTITGQPQGTAPTDRFKR